MQKSNSQDSSKKNLLVISHSGGLAGAESVLLSELRHLSKVFSVHLVIPRNSERLNDRVKAEGIPVSNIYRINVRLFGNSAPRIFIKAILNIPNIIRITKIIKENNICWIYSNSIVNWTGLLCSLLTSKKHVLHIHEHPNPNESYFDSKLDKLFIQLISKTATSCIFISYMSMQAWTSRLSIPSNIKCRVLYNPIETAAASNRQPRTKNLDGVNFGFAGTMYPRKNVIFLVDTFIEYSNGKADKLVIAGSGPQEGEAKRLVNSSNQRDNFIFMGQVENINDFLNSIDVLILPSIADAMPLIVFEAMIAEKICIVTDRTGLSELFNNNEHIIFFPPTERNTLISLLHNISNNFESFKSLSLNAKSRVLELSDQSNYVSSLLELFESN